MIISKADIIGHTLDAVFGTYFLQDEWLDQVDTFFVLKSGTVFRLPGFADEAFESIQIPAHAKPIRHPNLDVVLGREIAAVYRPRSDEDFFPGAVCLRMEDGHWVWTLPTHPHGTGAAGIHVRAHPPFDERQDMIDFWG
jgi:hypothetical protein